MSHQFQYQLVTQVVVQTTQDVVVTVTHHHSVVIAQQVVVLVLTAVKVEQEVLVVTDRGVTLTSMVAVAMVMDHTIVMATIPLVDHFMVVDNHHLMVKQTILIDTNHTLHGVLVATDLSMATEVLKVVKV
jgi:hypothetical protein